MKVGRGKDRAGRPLARRLPLSQFIASQDAPNVSAVMSSAASETSAPPRQEPSMSGSNAAAAATSASSSPKPLLRKSARRRNAEEEEEVVEVSSTEEEEEEIEEIEGSSSLRRSNRSAAPAPAAAASSRLRDLDSKTTSDAASSRNSTPPRRRARRKLDELASEAGSNRSSRASSKETPGGECHRCQLCASGNSKRTPQFDGEADLQLHYVTSHFKEQLGKLLPSAMPFKCPQCAKATFKTRSALLEHYGIEHKLVDKFLQDALKKSRNGRNPRRSQRRASLEEAESKESSKTNSTVELSDDDSEDEDDDEEDEEEEEEKESDVEEEEMMDVDHNSDSAKLSKGRMRCKLCRAVVPNRTKLKKHAADKHFKDEIAKDLCKTKPFKCPVKACSYERETFQALFRHYAATHNTVEKFMSQVEYSSTVENGSTNGATAAADVQVKAGSNNSERDSEAENDEDDDDSGDADSEESEESEETNEEEEDRSDATAESQTKKVSSSRKKGQRGRPLKYAGKNVSMSEFRKQVHENLRTLDGKHAEAVDDKNIKCVCGKVVRLCGRFYWRYLVQKPNVKNGVVVQKGHWFTCQVVQQSGSHIPPHVVTQQDIDASKYVYKGSSSRASVTVVESDDSDGDASNKRRSKRVVDKDEPEVKRSRAETEEDGFNMERHIRELLNTRVPGETFLQDGPCFQMGFDVSMCHMCRKMPYANRRTMLIKGHFDEASVDISCCFYSFRKLKYTKSGHMTVAGYLDPAKDPADKDMTVWLTNADSPPDIPLDKVVYTLGLIGDQFCDMVLQERKCLYLHVNENKATVWKPAVRGVREMCDVCKTTLFNYHWTCGRCGIVVCLDCYQFRRTGLVKDFQKTEDADEYDWPLCNNHEGHQMERMMMAQIIPRSALVDMARKMHEARAKYKISQFCHQRDEFPALLNDDGLIRFGGAASINKERAAKLYPCQLCDDMAFKWKYELYKHCLIKHFNEEVKAELPDEYPNKCPKCEYVGKNRTTLALHYGITHREVVKFIENALKNNPEAYKLKALPQPEKVYTFKCPLCSLSLSLEQRNDHLCLHFKDELALQLPQERPFQCPECRFVGLDRASLARHFGSFHNHAVDLLKTHLADKGMDMSSVEDMEIKHPVCSSPPNDGQTECRLCESFPLFRSYSEFLRHLTEIHFIETVSAEVPKFKANEKSFKCGRGLCDFSAMARSVLINHYGLHHRLTIKLYFEVMNIKEDWEKSDVFGELKKSSLSLGSAQEQRRLTCKFCNQEFLDDDLLVHLANEHFLDKVSALPRSVPFRCPLCPHFSASYVGLLRHFGLYHNKFDHIDVKTEPMSQEEEEMRLDVKDEMCSTEQSELPSNDVVMASTSGIDLSRETDSHQAMRIQCLMCDDCKYVGVKSGDFLKHLAEIHFRERLFAAVLVVQDEQGKRFACPYPTCQYEHQYRYQIAKHYGVKHRMVKAFYEEVTGFVEEASVKPTKKPARKKIALAQPSMPPAQLPMMAGYATAAMMPSDQSQFYHQPPHVPHYQNVVPPSMNLGYNQMPPAYAQQHLPSTSSYHHPQVYPPQTPRAFDSYDAPSISDQYYHKSAQNVAVAARISPEPPKPQVKEEPPVFEPPMFVAPPPDMHESANTSSSTQSGDSSFEEDVEAKCRLCNDVFTAHRYLLTHLSDAHFQLDLDKDLPPGPPWKCPLCNYAGSDPKALRVHYGVRHKVVLQYLASKLGIDVAILRRQMKEGRKQAVANKTVLTSQQTGGAAKSGNPQKSDLAQPASALPPYKAIAEDKKFPKCRVCDYRYFTRLDLCRHFVDNHLRAHLKFAIPEGKGCPVCPLTYDKKQSRLRHFVWSHQDLEKMVVNHISVRLSEFMPSTRDLDIVKIKSESKAKLESGGAAASKEAKPEFKDLTDLASLPVNDTIDVKCNVPTCELCGEEFTTSVNKVRDKGVHLLSHFRDKVLQEIPNKRPFNCPKCTFEGRDVMDLSRHYGLSHKTVFRLMREELGENWVIDETEAYDCKICSQVLLNGRALNDHYCTQHFYQKIATGMSTEPPFKCNQCPFQSKIMLALIRHYGSKHKMVKKMLQEGGYTSSSSKSSADQRRASTSSVSSNPGSAHKDNLPALPSDHNFTGGAAQNEWETARQSRSHADGLASHEPTLHYSQQQQHYGQEYLAAPVVAPQQSGPPPASQHFPADYVRPPQPAPIQQILQAAQIQQHQHVLQQPHQQPPHHPMHNNSESHYPKPGFSSQQQQHQPQPAFHQQQAVHPAGHPSQNDPRLHHQATSHPAAQQQAYHQHQQLQQHHQPQSMVAPQSQYPADQVDMLHARHPPTQQPGHQGHPQQQPPLIGHQQTHPPQKPLQLQHRQHFASPEHESSYQVSLVPEPTPTYHHSPLGLHQQPNAVHGLAHGAQMMSNLPVQQAAQPIHHHDYQDDHSAASTVAPYQQASGSGEPKGASKDAKAPKPPAKSQSPMTCPICHGTFLNMAHFLRHAADKHFMEQLKNELPQSAPFKCPVCVFEGKDIKLLVRHYGIKHEMVVRILNEQAGKVDCFEQDILRQFETSDGQREICPLCKSSFGGRYMLLRHLADCHFRERLCQGLQQGDVYKCPACNHESKDKGGYVRHYGLVHKMVQKWLREMGIHIDDEVKKPGGGSSQHDEPLEVDTSSNYQLPPVLAHGSAAAAAHMPSPAQEYFSPNHHAPRMEQQQPQLTSPHHHHQTPPPPRTTSRQSFEGHHHQSSYHSPPVVGGHQGPSPQDYYHQQNDMTPQAAHLSAGFHGGSPYGQMHHSQSTPVSPQYVQRSLTPQNQLSYPPLTPQTPQPPLTPGSQGTITPGPASVSQENHSMSAPSTPSSGLISPALGQYYPDGHGQYQYQQHSVPPIQQQGQHLAPGQPAQLQQRPVVLQQQQPQHLVPSLPSPAVPSAKQAAALKSNNNTPEDFIEPADPGLAGPFYIQCQNCHLISKTKSDFFRHLSEKHYKNELTRELPSLPPFRCPETNCAYEAKDTSIGPLIKHYGIVHKAVIKYLANKIVGKFVPSEMKQTAASSKQSASHSKKKSGTSKSGQVPLPNHLDDPVLQQQHHQQQLQGHLPPQGHQQQFPPPPPAAQHGGSNNKAMTMSNQSLTLKCPFCELMLSAPYALNQHLCDKHFKEALAQQLPAQPPFACPANGCSYIAKDSRQSLIRHYGMTHKMVLELLKQHAPGYDIREAAVCTDAATNSRPDLSKQNVVQEQHYYNQYPDDQYHRPQPHVLPLPESILPPMNDFYSSPEYNNHHHQQHQVQLPHHGHHPPVPHHGNDMRFDQQIDGTFDPSHYSDHSLDGIRSFPTTPVKEASLKSTSPVSSNGSARAASVNTPAAASTSQQQPVKAEPSSATPKPTRVKIPMKTCEVCGKQFEGKNKAMLRVQHLAQHFKTQLFADLPDKEPPFRCPIEDCPYKTKHKPDWARHYGSVHKFIDKYLDEHLAGQQQQQGADASSSSCDYPMEQQPPAPSKEHKEARFSECLPKAELSQIISTAIDQQRQANKDFGLVTVHGTVFAPTAREDKLEASSHFDLIDQVIKESAVKEESERNHIIDIVKHEFAEMGRSSEPATLQCFICEDGGEFTTEDELNSHISANHFDFTEEFKNSGEKLTLLSTADVESTFVPASDSKQHLFGSHEMAPTASGSLGASSSACEDSLKSGPSDQAAVDKRSSGKACDICGYEPKTKNKSRERSDHLAMKHYKERIEQDLSVIKDLTCPICKFKGRDKQTIYRHYTGKHRVVERYLAEDIAAGKVFPGQQQQVGPPAAMAEDEYSGPSLPPLPSFVATALDLQNQTNVQMQFITNSLPALAEGESGGIHERIMQVDGAFDDDSDDEEPMQQVDGSLEDEMFEAKDDEDDQSAQDGSLGKYCPLCGEETKFHRTYHYALKHFKERLVETLPASRPFMCIECQYEAKTKINLWTHYLGKHRFAKLWLAEAVAAKGMIAPPKIAEPTPPKAIPSAAAWSAEASADHNNLLPFAIKTEQGTTPIKRESESESNPGHHEESSSTTTTPKRGRPAAETPSSNRRTDFWCDLCQRVVTNSTKANHCAIVHFADRLSAALPAEAPFMCPFCRLEAKSLLNLSTHYLTKHNFLQEWIRVDLEKMALEAIANPSGEVQPAASSVDKENQNPGLEPISAEERGMSSTEEISTDEEEFQEPDPSFVSLFDGVDDKDLIRKTKVTKRKQSKRLRKSDGGAFILGEQYTSHIKTFMENARTSRDPVPKRKLTMDLSKSFHPDVPHSWLCDGRLLLLTDPTHPNNIDLFKEQWIRGQPVIVTNVSTKLDIEKYWSPDAFKAQFGHLKHTIVNTKTNKLIPNAPLKKFWDGFDHLSERMVDEFGKPMLLKLKDWPPDNDFAAYLPERFADLMRWIPLQDYTLRQGRLNLARSIPDFFVRPDLGPKMYIAYGNALYPETGTTNLHIDMSDACNLIVYVGVPKDGNADEHHKMGLRTVDESDCDVLTRQRVRQEGVRVGAIWHIYHPRDADKIRDMLNRVSLEKGLKLEPNTDPIHDQKLYLDERLRRRLYEEYGVLGYTYPQCEGDTVFIPAGAPHQVRNVHNCIKVAEDFVSPENLEWCFYQTEEFRHLSDTHSNHEDKLQIKNILYHAVKDCLSVLEAHEKREQEQEQESSRQQDLDQQCDDPPVEVKKENECNGEEPQMEDGASESNHDNFDEPIKIEEETSVEQLPMQL